MTPATTLTLHDVEQSILDWALDYGITPGIIIGRLDRGASVADAITMPMQVGFRGQRLPHGFSEALIRKNARANKRALAEAMTPAVRGRPLKTYSHGGRTMTIKAWATFTGLGNGTLRGRLSKGWTFERAISEPYLGVVANLRPIAGTGGGSTLQASTNITFSEEASR